MKKTHSLVASALIALLVSPTHAQTLPKMHLHWQSLDGNPADVVGPSFVASADASVKRVWGLQGRRREVWRVSDRLRFFDEEDPDFSTRLNWGAIDVDNSDPADDRLFTLTERQVQTTETGDVILPAVIKVDRIQNQSAPFTLQELEFPTTEAPRHIATDPERDLLLVVMAGELRIYDYSSGTLPDPLVPLGVAPIPTGLTGCHDDTLSKLTFAQVEDIGPEDAQQRMALVAATVFMPGCNPDTQIAALVICNIQDPSQPDFYDTDLALQAWQPCRRPPPPLEPCEDWKFSGFTHVRTIGTPGTPPKDLVYVIGGEDVQLTELDVTGVADPGTGIVENPTHYPVTSSDPLDPLYEVVADPEGPGLSDYLYIIGRHNVYVVDRANLGAPGWISSTAVGFGDGPAGDGQLMLADPGGSEPVRREIWSLAKQQARYVFRVTDFTQDGGALDPPDTSEGYHSAGPTDGAVASFGWSLVYILTFGGVACYDISGSVPVPVAYQPACDPCTGPAQKEFTTELLELVNFGTVTSPQWRLIATTANGGFYAWPLDLVTHYPLPGQVYQPAAGYWPDWPQGFSYGNGIATATHQTTGDKWVFMDYSNAAVGGLGTNQFAIGRYNWTVGGWPGMSITWKDPSPGVAPDILPLAHDITVEGNRWLLVAANGGFLVIDLLAPAGQAVTDWVYTDNVDGVSFSDVWGTEKHGNRIFTSLADAEAPGHPSNRFALAMYAFDATTGHVVDLQGQQTDDPIQVLFDGSAGKPDHFPGVFLNGGEKMSRVQIQAIPTVLRLYSGTGNGHLVEIEWQQSTDAMTPLSYWHNGGYFDHVADCNVYMIPTVPPGGASFGPELDFTLRIVVGKTRETFEIVSPPDMP